MKTMNNISPFYFNGNHGIFSIGSKNDVSWVFVVHFDFRTFEIEGLFCISENNAALLKIFAHKFTNVLAESVPKISAKHHPELK